MSFSQDEIERSATEWFGSTHSVVREWFTSALRDPKQHRDIGKVLAYAAETHVMNVVSEMTGRKIRGVYGKAYDGETNDDGPRVRHQVKFRSGTWHLETTRRNSAKNQGVNQTGHVAYRSNEFDLLFIFIPGKAFGLTGSKIRCVPADDLVDPKRPGQLRTSANPLRKKYDNDEAARNVILKSYLVSFSQKLVLPPG